MGKTKTIQDKNLLIQDAFMELYARKQIHEISIRELCDRVGMARTTFYNYYTDIYEVLETIEDALIEDLKDFNSSFFKQDFRRISKDSFTYFIPTLQYIADRKEWFRVLLNKGKDGLFIHKWKGIIKEDFRDKYRYEQIKLENEDLVLEMIASGAIGVYMYWVENLDTISIETVGKEVLYRLNSDFI